MIDIKKKIDQVVDNVRKDENLGAEFKKDPVKTAEKILGVDLPDEAVKSIVDEAKSKLVAGGQKAGGMAEKAGETIAETAGKASSAVTDAVGGAMDSIKNLF